MANEFEEELPLDTVKARTYNALATLHALNELLEKCGGADVACSHVHKLLEPACLELEGAADELMHMGVAHA